MILELQICTDRNGSNPRKYMQGYICINMQFSIPEYAYLYTDYVKWNVLLLKLTFFIVLFPFDLHFVSGY